jgi:hypothetical protein
MLMFENGCHRAPMGISFVAASVTPSPRPSGGVRVMC